MLPDNVALPDTLKSPVIATNPALIVCTVVPAIVDSMLPLVVLTATFEVPKLTAFPLTFRLVNPLPSPKYVPLNTMLPTPVILALPSSTLRLAVSRPLLIPYTVVDVVNERTSIKSPTAGASVNVNVTPLTA